MEEGYDPAYGARPLRRVVEKQVENALARRILAGEFAEDERIVVDYAKDGGYTFSKAKKQAKAS